MVHVLPSVLRLILLMPNSTNYVNILHRIFTVFNILSALTSLLYIAEFGLTMKSILTWSIIKIQ